MGVTLPGTLPGLLRRGAPVDYNGCAGVVLASGINSSVGCTVRVATESDASGFDEYVSNFNPSALALDLSDPAGMDIAARWLAERLGNETQATAPTWVRGPMESGYSDPDGIDIGRDASDGWYLTIHGDSDHFSSDGYCEWDDDCHRVPDISEVTDPALALKMACLVVAEGGE